MGLEYRNREDAVLRLDDTVCMYKGEPYYVRVLPNKEYVVPNPVSLYPLDGLMDHKKMKVVSYTDDDFNYYAPRLGYMTYRRNAHYVMRRPDRRQSQGLRQSALEVVPNIDRYHTFINQSAFRECILGQHRNLRHAMRLIDEEGYGSCSIHRHFAIADLGSTNRIALLYRGRFIGMLTPDKKVFKLVESAPENKLLIKIAANSGVFNEVPVVL